MTTAIVAAVVGGLVGVVPAAQATTSATESAAVTTGVTESTAVTTDVVKTADLSQFQAGNIITDAVFYDSSTMTQSQIQDFLNSKVSSCKSGYTCLKNWTGPSSSQSANAMCSAFSGSSSETAASLIYKVSQACGINPQVLLVMIQKEQGLVTSTAPSTYAYNFAMGYNCPDTTGCTSDGLGFATQVYGGAYMLKRYSNPSGTSQYFTWYAPGKTWSILYNPSTSCGSSAVYIQNQATANLYYYTPYQPNAAALAAGYGTGDSCSAYGNRNFYNYFTDWFGSTQVSNAASSPFGYLDAVETAPGVFHVRGWAADPDTSASIAVHIYVGSTGYAVSADQNRPDVANAYPSLGAAHGYDATVSATGSGTFSVCAYGINVGAGTNSLLGCATVTAMSGSPVGSVDGLDYVSGGIHVRGWAIDPDSTASVTVTVSIDVTPIQLTADQVRSDVALQYPAYGTKHGYESTIDVPGGMHRICISVANVGAGTDTTLSCVTTLFASRQGDPDQAPVGALDSVTVSGQSAVVRGWAIDPDTVGATSVHIYVNSSASATAANVTRSDVGKAYPVFGSEHGYETTVALPAGTSTVCAYGINVGAGANVLLGCKTVTAAMTPGESGRATIGALDDVVATGTTLQVRGWTIDPDTADPIYVHVYVDGEPQAFRADALRTDVAAVYPAYGSAHGFTASITVAAGRHTVCAYGIDTQGNQNTNLGCRSLTVG